MNVALTPVNVLIVSNGDDALETLILQGLPPPEGVIDTPARL
jgi:hypothetical protein